MCLIAFNFSPTRNPWLVLTANRDEFHARPTRPLAWWSGPESLLAGRDEQAGGTWLGITRDGRWAAVTNLRDPRAGQGECSRGALPTEFLTQDVAPEDYARAVYSRRQRYGPFNLLVGNAKSLWYVSSHAAAQRVLPGVHALSNGLLDTPWPKSRRSVTALRHIGESADQDRLIHLMNDREPAADHELPDTGVGLERERFLSAPFIVSERYGTRCTTVALLGGSSRVLERRFDVMGNAVGEIGFHFDASMSSC